MIIGNKGKQYGLVKPAPKPAPAAVRKPIAAFAEDSDDEEGTGHGNSAVERDILRQGAKKVADKKVQAMQAAALAEDPNVFDYDGVYDELQQQRVQPRQQEKVQRKSKYIEALLDKAVERKREQDIRFERQVAKEQAVENHLYGDKEAFVTANYRKKLEEDKLWLASQKQREAEEAANDVTKRGHMGDFYRNLLSHNVAFGGTTKAAPTAAPSGAAGGDGAAAAASAGAPAEAGPGEEAPEELAAMAREALAAARSGGAASAGVATAAAAGAGERAERGGPGAGPSRRSLEQQGGAAAAAHKVEAGSRDRSGGLQSPAAPAGPAGAGATEAAEAGAGRQAQAGGAAGGARRNDNDRVAAARERYLARKRKVGDVA